MIFDKQLEKKTLKTNFIIAIGYAFFSIIIVYFAQSLTVLLDTSYSVISILIYAISIYVLRKLNQPANKRYNYGYYRLEPVFIILESWFVLLVALSVILMAIFNMFTHTIKPNYGVALLSEIVGTALCVYMYFFVNKRANQTGSKILFTDAQMWKADALLGLGVIFNIMIGFVLEKSGFDTLAIYVDPIVAILIGFYIVISPIKLIKEAYQHLLDAAPSSELKKQIFKVARTVASEGYNLPINNIKITQSGRFIFVDLYLDLPKIVDTQKILQFKTKLQREYERALPHNKLKVYISL
ncbi:cation diffusion facilitator family transporter [Allofrancisella guangzhouensis]|uniref:Cation transporter n=1 Tax=Allofrancisella guangzhouensis TaxID=594679 RepID=A0A0A8E6N4_9GAMM|nr:cation diffusion facilitator family transporter [Allofrancisella guangzhouensis]AJC49262.1 cation transporter [Allofrancisella guangzhouensis]MBK2027705.1 cation diffusion facilitator family transporter [Allofrancisella guangzhouensis]MBK2044881.1 cation diffusion facilitator family transporter [Allofrancisella guangzhouensis]MBK2046406.1 cation diffusion facilitator family transporter [Allofrancisella guangzhouensis]